MSTTAVFAGYAYYSASGDGFAYALSNTTGATMLDTPVVVVDEVHNAAHFFQLLFLVAGGALSLLLLIIVAVAFCCRHQVMQLEMKALRLQHAYAEANNALVSEALDRTPVKPAWPTKRPPPPKSKPKRRSSKRAKSLPTQPPEPAQPPQQQPLQPRPTSRIASPQVPSATATVTPPPFRLSNPWMLASEPLGVYPPRQSPSQPLFPAPPTEATQAAPTSTATFDYNSIYVPTPIISFSSAIKAAAQDKQPEQEQQQQQMDDATSASAPQHPLRRRSSKVSFINTA